MEKVQMWKTSDGSIFEEEDIAIEHEMDTIQEDNINEFFTLLKSYTATESILKSEGLSEDEARLTMRKIASELYHIRPNIKFSLETIQDRLDTLPED